MNTGIEIEKDIFSDDYDEVMNNRIKEEIEEENRTIESENDFGYNEDAQTR